MEHIFSSILAQLFQVFEHLMLFRDLAMALKMIGHLVKEVIAQPIVIYLLRNWSPSELKMR